MDNSQSTAFDVLMKQLSTLPLWVKQVIYAQLQRELEISLSYTTLQTFTPEHTLQLWVPELNRHGVLEMEKHDQRPPAPVLKLLHWVRHHKNIITITIMNQWSLGECSDALAQAIDLRLIEPPVSMAVAGTIDYMAGRIRLGEYLVKISRLNIDQLDQALRTQRAIQEAMGERVGIANVLINLGYIKKEDSESILFLKEESRKAFHIANLATESPEVSQARERIHQLEIQLQKALQHIQKLEGNIPPPSGHF